MPALRPLLVAVTALAVTAAGVPAQAATPKKADLRVTATQTVAFTGAAGKAVRTIATVKNVGTKRAPASTAGLFLSRDVKLGASDRRLDTTAVGSLAPGARARPTLAGVLPTALASGGWRLLACADINDTVRERTGTNNCSVWKSFTVDTTPPVVEQGPLGGATTTCGGTYRPFSNGTTAPEGVHFTVSPVTDTVVVEHVADGVGFEALYSDEEYRQTVVSITNDGTASAALYDVQPLPCEYDGADADYWGVLHEADDLVAPQDRCEGTLLPGETCQLSIFADRVKRGGNALPGALRISGQLPGQVADVWAVFPIRTTVQSRGYLELQTLDSDSMNNVPPGTVSYQVVEATNVGDRPAVPTFSITEAAGTPLGVFDQGGPSWTPLNGGAKCATTHDPGPPPVTSGALSPGGKCQFRIRVCSTLSETLYEATLYAKNAYTSSVETYSFPYDLRYSTATGGDGNCDDAPPGRPGNARAGAAPRVGPASAVAGEPITVRAQLPTRTKRAVVLQRKQGARWIAVARKQSTGAGKVVFTLPASRVTVRVQAPRAGSAKAYTSSSKEFRPSRPMPSFVADARDVDVSANGRYVAFSSNAGDPSGHDNVFTWDRETGSLDMISYSVTPGDADGDNLDPSISADGRTVAFRSDATNLVAGDTNGTSDVVLWESGVGFSRMSVDDAGGQSVDGGYAPSLSDNGRTVAFLTSSALDVGDGNGVTDLYVRFRDDNITNLVSAAAGGGSPNAPTMRGEISGDGNWVVFETAADDVVANDDNGFADLFRVSLYAPDKRILTRGGNGASQKPSISYDGQRVAFVTGASNLAPGTATDNTNVLVWSAKDGKRQLVSRPSGRTGAANTGSNEPSISGNGRFVAFISFATNLGGGSTGGHLQAYVRSLGAEVTSPASVTSGQKLGDADTFWTALDRSGRHLALLTAAGLDPSDSGGGYSAYLVDRRTAG